MIRIRDFTDRPVGHYQRTAPLEMRLYRAAGWSDAHGTYLDRHLGMIEVHVQHTIEGRRVPWTNLTGIRRSDGRSFRRSWPRAWSHRTLATLCRRFLEDLDA